MDKQTLLTILGFIMLLFLAGAAAPRVNRILTNKLLREELEDVRKVLADRDKEIEGLTARITHLESQVRNLLESNLQKDIDKQVLIQRVVKLEAELAHPRGNQP